MVEGSEFGYRVWGCFTRPVLLLVSLFASDLCAAVTAVSAARTLLHKQSLSSGQLESLVHIYMNGPPPADWDLRPTDWACNLWYTSRGQEWQKLGHWDLWQTSD